MWNIINSNVNKSVKSSDIILKDDGNMVHSSKVSNKFINYFTTVVKDLTNTVPKTNIEATSFLRNENKKSFSMFLISQIEVENAISQLKNLNPVLSISCSVIDSVKSVISPYLTDIFNLCISQGHFPTELKVGRITPIHKKGCKFSISNYRPVCNLSPFSKIFERIIYNRMIDFIEVCNIFSNTQYGFRKCKSTETALI